MASTFTREQLVGLPDPVVRYFEFALTPDQSLVRAAHVRQAGMFALKPGAWSRFTAVEHFTVRPPTLVWDARIRMAPLISVRVRDSYIDGVGATVAKIAGLVPIATLRGGPQMASGALLRYLAEAVWLPTVLLPSESVIWSAIDDNAARATITDRAISVSLDVGFGENGAIVSARTLRYRAVGRTFELAPWSARYRDYERVSGMMIPMASEVEWQLPGTAYPYWRGRIVRAEYDFARTTT